MLAALPIGALSASRIHNSNTLLSFFSVLLNFIMAGILCFWKTSMDRRATLSSFTTNIIPRFPLQKFSMQA